MLPSGGGIRVLRQLAGILKNRFELEIHCPVGASEVPGVSTIRYPFPIWKKPKGSLKLIAPCFLILRLISFQRLCMKIAESMNETADAALVHNSMPIAAPPVLRFLEIPSAYFCFEYPRHLYDRDIVRRTHNPVWDALLAPLRFTEKRMDISSAKSATVVLSLSTYMQQMLHSIYGLNSEVIRPGIDTEFFCPGAESAEQSRYILSIGAIWPFKGHETAIRIVSEVPEAIRPELRIIGDRELPGYQCRLLELAAEKRVVLSIEKAVSDAELRRLYRSSSAVLCCQNREPYGLVPLEAMACGTPVLAVSEGGFSDNVFNGKNGLLFNGDSKEGGSILTDLLYNSELRSSLIAGGRSFAERERSIYAGTEKLSEILEKL